MGLKRNKSMILILLSLMISAAGCKKDDSFKKDIRITLEETMDKYDFYQEKDSSGNTNREVYSPFYYSYLKNFVDYMDEEQYQNFLNLVMSMNNSEKYDFSDTFFYLNEIMGYEKDKFGRGIYKAFNTRLVYENVFPAYDFDIDVYKEVNTLRSIVNDDEAFFSSLFSKDIDKFIECIDNNTGLKNKDLIQELVLNMDLYSDIISQEERTIADKELLEAYEKNIKALMKVIVKAKLTTDSNFADTTLYGEILKNSRYMENHLSSSYQGFLDGKINLWVLNKNCEQYYGFEMSDIYLYRNMSLDELKALKVEQIISEYEKEEDSFRSHRAVKLMIHLVEPNVFSEARNKSASHKRKLMYNDLEKYFKNIEEFDEFFLTIASNVDIVAYDYFDLINERINENGITIDDFSRYTSLVNLINDNESIYYEWESDVDYPDLDYINSLPKEEAKEIVRVSSSNYLFDITDYKLYLDMIGKNLKDNSLGFELVYNPQCNYDYSNGEIVVKDEKNSVISGLVEAKKGCYNGLDVMYYEIPLNFDNGSAVSVFENIEDKLTIKEINGFKLNFFDEISGKEICGFIVDLENSKTDVKEYQPIRFIENYKNYEKLRNHKNKELKLGEKK